MKYIKNVFVEVLLFCLIVGVFNNTFAQEIDKERFEALSAKNTDIVFGNNNSKVIIVELYSLSCSYCAVFHREILPKIKKEFIDTGKVKYIIKDFPHNTPAMYATMLANCSGNKKYQYITMLLESQNAWAFTDDYKSKLHGFAKLGGMSNSEFEKCWNDNSAKDEVLKSVFDVSRVLKTDVRPTFFINGKLFEGELSFSAISKEIKKIAFNG